jgi:hypothetical protein
MTLNLISGFSVWFFQTDEVAEIERSEAAKGGRRESAWRFKSFVKAYWPQLDPEPASAEGTAQRLYEARNSSRTTSASTTTKLPCLAATFGHRSRYRFRVSAVREVLDQVDLESGPACRRVGGGVARAGRSCPDFF